MCCDPHKFVWLSSQRRRATERQQASVIDTFFCEKCLELREVDRNTGEILAQKSGPTPEQIDAAESLARFKAQVERDRLERWAKLPALADLCAIEIGKLLRSDDLAVLQECADLAAELLSWGPELEWYPDDRLEILVAARAAALRRLRMKPTDQAAAKPQ